MKIIICEEFTESLKNAEFNFSPRRINRFSIFQIAKKFLKEHLTCFITRDTFYLCLSTYNRQKIVPELFFTFVIYLLQL